jgi:hypothetical protein
MINSGFSDITKSVSEHLSVSSSEDGTYKVFRNVGQRPQLKIKPASGQQTCRLKAGQQEAKMKIE